MKWQVINKPGKYTFFVGKNEAKGVFLAGKQAGVYQVAVELAESGAKALILGIVLGKDENKIKILSKTRHWVSNTHAETIVYGTNRDKSETELKGLIRIDKGANQVTDFFTAKILLLSAMARAMIEPGLEIKADEVRASHAATVATVDKEQVYYLMSRGLSARQAEKLIVAGFINQVVKRVENVKIQQQINDDVKY